MEKLLKQFNETYQHLYDMQDDVAHFMEAVRVFDEYMQEREEFKKLVLKFNEYRHDMIASDREAAAFIFTLARWEVI